MTRIPLCFHMYGCGVCVGVICVFIYVCGGHVVMVVVVVVCVCEGYKGKGW